MKSATKKKIEDTIIKKVVESAVRMGYMLSVWSDDDWVCKFQTDEDVIINSVDKSTTVAIYVLNGSKSLGVIYLIKGSGYDVIAEYTYCEKMHNILGSAFVYAEKMRRRFG